MKNYKPNIISFLLNLKSGKVICILSFVLFAPSINAKQVTVCNISPLNIYLAVRLGAGPEQPTIGWFSQEPGDCRTWDVNGNTFFYYAESHEELAYWINDGKPQKWNSTFGYSMCVDPKLAFEMPANGSCQTKYNFKRVALTNQQKINLYATNQRHLELEGLIDARRQLTGVMEYEKMLRNSSGVEAYFNLGLNDMDETHFHLGINAIDDIAGNGALITRIFSGMPAEIAGLEVNDKIVFLNGYRIENRNDVTWVLENYPVLTSEPLSMAVIRDGQRIEGMIEPYFFPFKHKEYRENDKAGAFLWSAYDAAMFGLGNEVTCAAPQVLVGGLALILDGISAALSDRQATTTQGQLFNKKQLAEDYKNCAENLNSELKKMEALYSDAYTAGLWAGVLVPGVPTARYLKAQKTLPLAARSRKVARKPGQKAFQMGTKYSN